MKERDPRKAEIDSQREMGPIAQEEVLLSATCKHSLLSLPDPGTLLSAQESKSGALIVPGFVPPGLPEEAF